MDILNLKYLTRVSDVLRLSPDIESLGDAFSRTQFESKQWLIQELLKIPDVKEKKIAIIGGWYGAYLLPLVTTYLHPKHIFFNDKDSEAIRVCNLLNGKENISYSCFDVTTGIDMLYENNPDIIINTSCEHMNDMKTLINKKSRALYVLQSCNTMNDPGHINAHENIDEFILSSGLSSLLFYGTKDLGHKKRFMVIGFY